MLGNRFVRTASVVLLALTVVIGAFPEPAGAPPPPMEPCPGGRIDPATGKCIWVSLPPLDGGGGGGDPDPDPNPNPNPGPPRPPSPEELIRGVLVKASSLLLNPTVETTPGGDDNSIVAIPTFVEVTNWQGQQRDRYCEGIYCVTIIVTPSLSFDPGEPGAPIVECEDGGTAFDPNGPEPDVQAAAPGACAYAYEMRTGVRGRPAGWTAEVIINWAIEWRFENVDPPDDIDLPATEVTSTEVLMPVDEVQTIVVGGG